MKQRLGKISIAAILVIALGGCQFSLPNLGKKPLPTLDLPPTSTVALPTATETLVPLPTSTPTDLPPTPTIDPVLDPAQIKLETITRTEEGTAPPYKITAEYPALTSPQDPRLTAFNVEVENLIQSRLDGFMKDVSNVIPDPNFGPVLSTQQITYTNTYFGVGVISVNFAVGWYMSGAAHPNSYNLTLTYDLLAGKRVNLADLFIDGSNYLQVLSDYCKQELSTRGTLEFPAGADPTEENYQNWNLTPAGVQITFDPYQVGPYAMGPQVVDVPFSALTAIMRNTDALARVLNANQTP